MKLMVPRGGIGMRLSLADFVYVGIGESAEYQQMIPTEFNGRSVRFRKSDHVNVKIARATLGWAVAPPIANEMRDAGRQSDRPVVLPLPRRRAHPRAKRLGWSLGDSLIGGNIYDQRLLPLARSAGAAALRPRRQTGCHNEQRAGRQPRPAVMSLRVV